MLFSFRLKFLLLRIKTTNAEERTARGGAFRRRSTKGVFKPEIGIGPDLPQYDAFCRRRARPTHPNVDAGVMLEDQPPLGGIIRSESSKR